MKSWLSLAFLKLVTRTVVSISQNFMNPDKKKTRIVYLTNRRAYHLCTVILCRDLSVLITMPAGAKATSTFPIAQNDGLPVAGPASPIQASSIKFSYHPRTGFKHIKETAGGERLATYNSAPPTDPQGIFESLLRIFPEDPTRCPFVPKTKPSDIIVTDDVNDKKPISLLFTVTSADSGRIDIVAPPGTVVFPISGFGHLTVMVTLLPLTEKDKPRDAWPDTTMWTTPY